MIYLMFLGLTLVVAVLLVVIFLLPTKKKDDVPYEEMDSEVVSLCRVLNMLPGIKTVESCCGHLKSPYSIFFHAKNLSSLAVITRSFDKRYCGTEKLWVLEAVTEDQEGKDGFSTMCFWLHTTEPYDDEKQMHEDIVAVCNNLVRWSNHKYKGYFTGRR